MATAYTTNLGLALPITGELSGTWGDTINDSITSLLDSAVAGTTTLSSDADVVLTDTSGAANTAREAIILWTAGGTDTRYITAPARSKAYLVINKSSSTQSIVLRGVGPTTGVTIVKGESAVCAWNGSDFIKVSNTSGAGVFTSVTDSALTSGRVTYASTGGLLVDSANLTFNGTTLTASGFSGPLGATAANTGAFTTLSASSTVSGAGFSTYLASPPAIGGTAAAAGAFTTLSASSTVSGAGFSTYLASPPAIGGTAAAAGSFTSLSYSTTLTGGTGIVNLGSGQFYKDASGNVGIGTSSLTGYTLRISKDITGSGSSYAIYNDGTIQSDVANAWGMRTGLSTAASVFTVANLRHYEAQQLTIGASSTVTNQVGFFVDNSLTGATNNYGFFSNIASGTNRWNFYANGTAQNYFAGNVLIGTTTSPAGSKELVLGGDYIEGVVAIGSSGTAKTISLTNGTVQTVTLTGNCTFTMPTAVAGKSFTVILNTGAGSFTSTFTSVKWPNNTAPTITTTASRWDILSFISDGTNWYGNFAQAYQ